MLRPRSDGFTLVELMVAVALLIIVLAAMLPSIGSWVQGLAVRNMAESMRAGLEKARVEALRRNTDMSFWLVSSGPGVALDNSCVQSPSGTSWVVSVLSPDSACLAAPSNDVSPLLVERWSGVQAGRNVQVLGRAANGSASSSVTFDTLGRVRAGGSPLTQLDISHGSGDRSSRRLRLQLDPGGSVRLCDIDATGADPRRCL